MDAELEAGRSRVPIAAAPCRVGDAVLFDYLAFLRLTAEVV
jgi:hypothetical protein